jgi:hypothetical protein
MPKVICVIALEEDISYMTVDLWFEKSKSWTCSFPIRHFGSMEKIVVVLRERRKEEERRDNLRTPLSTQSGLAYHRTNGRFE